MSKKAKGLARMRQDAGLDQDALAFMIYKDPKKRQRIGKIERGEVVPTFREALAWMRHCCVGVDREEVMEAIKTLERVSQNK